MPTLIVDLAHEIFGHVPHLMANSALALGSRTEQEVNKEEIDAVKAVIAFLKRLMAAPEYSKWPAKTKREYSEIMKRQEDRLKRIESQAPPRNVI